MLESTKSFRILSIDGGGVKGIIPARILEEIEEKSGKPIYQLFDLIVGTSTGGLIALALTCPGSSPNTARYSAKEILNIYIQSAPQIFKHSIFRTIATGAGLWGAKYVRKPYDLILERLFGNTLLSQALCPVVVPTYSLNKGIPNLFLSSIHPKDQVDYFMYDIAGATSAAPTYFPPKVFKDSLGNTHIEADGGIFANNPETVGIEEAYALNTKLRRSNIQILSIGTGRVQLAAEGHTLTNAGVIGWVMKAKLIDIMIDAVSAWRREEITALYPNSHRLQVSLPAALAEMDNVSPANLQGLLNVAENFIADNKALFHNIITQLLS